MSSQLVTAAKATVDNVLKIRQQYEDARKQAIAEILAQQQELTEELRRLGHDGSPAKKAKGATDPNKKCPVCGEPGHDARRHRADKEQKGAA